jgi:hypothetical protein
MNINISINVDNDSFNDPREVERVLKQVVNKLSHRGYADETTFDLMDINGNSVGFCKVDEE